MPKSLGNKTGCQGRGLVAPAEVIPVAVGVVVLVRVNLALPWVISPETSLLLLVSGGISCDLLHKTGLDPLFCKSINGVQCQDKKRGTVVMGRRGVQKRQHLEHWVSADGLWDRRQCRSHLRVLGFLSCAAVHDLEEHFPHNWSLKKRYNENYIRVCN